MTDQVGVEKNLAPSVSLFPIYVRQCMNLSDSAEVRDQRYRKKTLFSEAFDDRLASEFKKRISKHFDFPAIPKELWQDNDVAFGRDILWVIIERSMLLLGNEALRHGASKEYAVSTYLGFMMRMAEFGFRKCLKGPPVGIERFGLPENLFTDASVSFDVFKSPEIIEEEFNRPLIPLTK